MGENWKNLDGWPGYKISDQGRVWSNKFNRPRFFQQNPHGYFSLSFSNNKRKKQFLVHRLVMITFVGPPPQGKPEVNHINGIKTDNRLSNLEWVSRSENMLHAVNTGLKPNAIGEKCHLSKLKNEEVLEIRRLYDVGVLTTVIANQFNITSACVSDIGLRNNWKQLKDENPNGGKRRHVRLNLEIAEKMRQLYSQGNLSQTKIGKMFNAHTSTVSLIVRNKLWVPS